jgi:hypothetical protein
MLTCGWKMGKCDGIVDLNTFKIIEKMAIVV